MINNYIDSIIDNHQEEFGLYFSGTSRDVIKENIIKGIYAFNIIYNDMSSVTEIIYLDHNLCIHEDFITDTLQSQALENAKYGSKWKMWSYDGGQRYQWSEMETLIFDPGIIRNIKIESIL